MFANSLHGDVVMTRMLVLGLGLSIVLEEK